MSSPLRADDAPPDAMIGQMMAHYLAKAGTGDLMAGAAPEMAARWRTMLSGLSRAGDGDFSPLQERASRQVQDLGMAFRLAGEADERAWPLSPVPLLIQADEWQRIEQGMAQRADLLEALLADIYGPQHLIADGKLPAALVAGSPSYWPMMAGASPPGGHHLHFYAADLARGPTGEWRVLADRTRAPSGAGYALENRLAMARVTGDLLGRMNVRRLAPFFAAFRQGLSHLCDRSDPRIALLTPGRFNQSYAEQAHLARYLGFMLVEGEDLTVQDDRLYVRTIAGIKRIDAVWRMMDTRFMDPLAFDSRSRIGVPDLFQAMVPKDMHGGAQGGGLVIANWPGSGVVEAPAFGAFLPRLARTLTGADLLLPNIATWWCGQSAERAHLLDRIETMAIGPAYGAAPGAPDSRPHIWAHLDADQCAALLAAIDRRPMDHIGQEIVRLSTTPAIVDGALAPRPFSLRVFLARDSSGAWRAMPGGFARLAAHDDIRAVLMGAGDMAADMCVVSNAPEPVISLIDTSPSPPVRRVAGTLPSKAADNLYWLARYLERAEMTLRMARSLLGGSIDADGAMALERQTMRRMSILLSNWGAVGWNALDGGVTALCRDAIADLNQPGSVHALFASARAIGQGLRERLASEFWMLLSRAMPVPGRQRAAPMLEHIETLINRLAALSGLAAENMVRGHGWNFHDMGRRIERAIHICRLLRTFTDPDTGSDDLTVLLDLCDCQISYRTRYLSGLSLHPIRDMLALEPQNPRSLAFQVDRILEHLDALPSLRNDGMPEQPARIATAIAAILRAESAETLELATLDDIERRLLDLSDAVGKRFFLQGNDAERAAGVTALA